MSRGLSPLSLDTLPNQGAEPTLTVQSMSARPPNLSLLTRAYHPTPTFPDALHHPASPLATHMQPLTSIAEYSARQDPISTAPTSLAPVTILPYRSCLPVSLGPPGSTTLPLHLYKDPPPAYAPYQSHLPYALPFALPVQLAVAGVQRGFGQPWSTPSVWPNPTYPLEQSTTFPTSCLFNPIFITPGPATPEKPPVIDSADFCWSCRPSTGVASPHPLAPVDESQRPEANHSSSLLAPVPFSSSPTVPSVAKDPFMGFMPLVSPGTYGTASPSELDLSAPAPPDLWTQTHTTLPQIQTLPSALPRLSPTADMPSSTQAELHQGSPIVSQASTGVPAPAPRVANWKPIEERPFPPRLELISMSVPPARQHVNPGLMIDPTRHPIGVDPVALNSASTTGWTVSTDALVSISHTAGTFDGEDDEFRHAHEAASPLSGSTFHTPDRSCSVTLEHRSSDPGSASTEGKGWTSDRPNIGTAQGAMQLVRELSRAGGRRKRAEASPGTRGDPPVHQVVSLGLLLFVDTYHSI